MATNTTTITGGGLRYIGVNNRVTVTITDISENGTKVPTVVGIIPPEYHFSVKNEYQSLLSANSAISNLNEGVQAINQLIGGKMASELSLVPFSPQIWMGADTVKVSEMVLSFVCMTNPKDDVHQPLMNLIAMALPRKSGYAAAALGPQKAEFGIMNHPPAIEIKIGNVISWSPCYISDLTVTEKAPYDQNGFGMTGDAKFTVIRRDYIFAESYGSGLTGEAANANNVNKFTYQGR